ncbi:MAG TPA: OFA family MFS transporter [Blastocatellia bacterium]|nr:OFA family MFS transporter [Blastocatellia bacterium]
MSAFSFLDREHTVAGPGFTRWLVPPAALAVHLAIGQAYAFSVFNKPLSQMIGITKSLDGVDWKISDLGWIFSTAIVVLGLSAAIFGKWVERSGPRKTMLVAACCFGAGFMIAGFGASIHSLLVIIFGYGVVGGIGLGLGYISPVSTLIKWFPDRPGMATGMAIMGFGGGALIGSPLATNLMAKFATPQSTGVVPTFYAMGAIYFVFMLMGPLVVRVPPPDWKPEGFVPPVKSEKLVTTGQVVADEAIKTPQFWLLWLVLFLNVTAGIGVLGQASLMLQEIFSGRLTTGITDQKAALAAVTAAGAGFTALLSLFNIAGRFFWSSLSDFLGRKNVYMIYFALGALTYALIPTLGKSGNIILFVLTFGVILSMYGGGFATIPAYLRDLFGTIQVGAIHGRLLTAWSAAGIAGPSLVNYIREYQINHGVAKADSYNFTMYVMAGLLVIGFICNFLVSPVEQKHYQKSEGKMA